jgi:hypothetical protein
MLAAFQNKFYTFIYFCWEVFMFRTLDLLHDFEMQLLVVF